MMVAWKTNQTTQIHTSINQYWDQYLEQYQRTATRPLDGGKNLPPRKRMESIFQVALNTTAFFNNSNNNNSNSNSNSNNSIQYIMSGTFPPKKQIHMVLQFQFYYSINYIEG